MAENLRYPVPKDRFRSEINVERSRFIATIHPVESEQQAQSFIAEIKSEFADANHNCWAYLIGSPGSSDRTGMSDDGEPHGAAGKPMLTVLLHSGFGDVVVVVTRHFGGIKLGKGGMVKAYTAAVKTALDQMPAAERISWMYFLCRVDYARLQPLETRLSEFEVEIIEKNYGEDVEIRLRLPVERTGTFIKLFNDLNAGQSQLCMIDSPEANNKGVPA